MCALSFFRNSCGLGQVLAVGALALVEVGDRVEPQPVDPGVEPELDGLDDGVVHPRVVEVEVRLVVVEAVPEIGVGDRVPGPVRGLDILEDDPRFAVLVGGVGPDIKVTIDAAGPGAPGALEPGVLVRGVVGDHLGDDLEAAAMGLADEAAHVAQRPVGGVHAVVVGDVVAVVAQRRGEEGQHPDGRHAQILNVIEALGQAPEVPDAVGVAVHKRADMHLIDDGVLVPLRVIAIRINWLG
jgi:hypothetical protein